MATAADTSDKYWMHYTENNPIEYGCDALAAYFYIQSATIITSLINPVSIMLSHAFSSIDRSTNKTECMSKNGVASGYGPMNPNNFKACKST